MRFAYTAAYPDLILFDILHNALFVIQSNYIMNLCFDYIQNHLNYTHYTTTKKIFV